MTLLLNIAMVALRVSGNGTTNNWHQIVHIPNSEPDCARLLQEQVGRASKEPFQPAIAWARVCLSHSLQACKVQRLFPWGWSIMLIGIFPLASVSFDQAQDAFQRGQRDARRRQEHELTWLLHQPKKKKQTNFTRRSRLHNTCTVHVHWTAQGGIVPAWGPSTSYGAVHLWDQPKPRPMTKCLPLAPGPTGL